MISEGSGPRVEQSKLDGFIKGLTIDFLKLTECAVSPCWRLSFPGNPNTAMHYNLNGIGRLIVGEFPPIRLMPHTFVVVPAKAPFRIEGDAPEGAMINQINVGDLSNDPNRVSKYIAGGNREGLLLVCGYVRVLYGKSLDVFDRLTVPLVEQFDENDMLDHALKSAVGELIAQEVGAGAMTASLVKEVLIRVLRRSMSFPDRWLERFPAFSDPQIARALAEMSAEPSAQHSVQSLASTAGLSRSRFMHRFTALVGMPPLAMLRRLRMRNAAYLLEADQLSIEAIARAVGYVTTAGFSRAFRAEFGVDPADYRDSHRNQVGAGESE